MIRVISPFGQDPGQQGAPPVPTPAPAPTTTDAGDLASTMVLRGAVGVLAGAAAAPKGKEGAWAAAGFVVGATFGQVGIVGLLAAALWMKTGSGGVP